MGVGYKFVIVFLINIYWVLRIFKDMSFINILSYMYVYSLYLFFDFVGYSLFVIGIGYIFGI